MAKAIFLPKIGMTMEEGTVARWLLPDGAAVTRGQPVFELETAKAIVEVEADGEGTLLDNSLVHFGAGMGTWHESTDLANLIAGHGGGRFKLGEHVDFKRGRLSNLYLTMLQTAGVPVDSFADGNEPLTLS